MGKGSMGSGANAPHPEKLPDSAANPFILALMNFMQQQSGTPGRGDLRSQLLTPTIMAGGGGDMESELRFMQALSQPSPYAQSPEFQ